MADIFFNCPKCGQSLDAPPEMAGNTITCPACKQSIVIPAGRRQQPMPIPRSRPSVGGAPLDQGVVGEGLDDEKSCFCRECGARINARAAVCPKCGVPTNVYARPTPPTPPKQPVYGADDQFCRECGTRISSNATFCPKCGVPTNNHRQSAPQEAVTNQLQKRGVGRRTLWIALGLIVALPLLYVLVGKIYRHHMEAEVERNIGKRVIKEYENACNEYTDASNKNACITNLRVINLAVHAYCGTYNTETIPTWNQLVVPGHPDVSFLKTVPNCPAGGTYSMPVNLSDVPHCSCEGHAISNY